MDLKRITELAYDSMAKRKAHNSREKGFIFYHGERVAKLAVNLRKQLEPNNASLDPLIYTGGLFHDVAKGIEPHSERGAVLIKEILKNEVNEEEMSIISEIILMHNKRKQPELPFYIKIIQDADVLDHFGSFEIWLKFMYSAHNGETVLDALNTWNSDWFEEYKQKCRQSLNYQLSKEIFDQKTRFFNEFLKTFTAEANGEFII